MNDHKICYKILLCIEDGGIGLGHGSVLLLETSSSILSGINLSELI